MSKQTIMVAEDEPHLREVLRFQLEAVGYRVLEARDGQQALEMATQALPDLLLLDVMMPYLNGYDVCRELRAAYATRHIPIIMLTAKAETQDKLEGLGGGANDYVTKPWEARELMLRVRNVLEWSRQQRSASPLTGLPGNLSINEEISRRMASHAPFAMMQVDIDYFKAFNDHYGYARGDLAIRRLADILVAAARESGGKDCFVGHIGGDDFVVLTSTESAEALGGRVISEFTSALPELYDPADFRRGHVEVLTRRHVTERVPVMSLTIALVSTDRMQVSHLAELNDIAQELKAHGKGIPGSVLVGERRRPPESVSEVDRHVA
ncbi:MAG: response regulator [Candidatus Eisenbacteria bacterium]|nr:response regulator [Candidatus Eisenbacteria bacterium]